MGRKISILLMTPFFRAKTIQQLGLIFPKLGLIPSISDLNFSNLLIKLKILKSNRRKFCLKFVALHGSHFVANIGITII